MVFLLLFFWLYAKIHFFEDKNQQPSHFFEDTFVEILYFFEDNSLYTVLDSKSTPTKTFIHPSNIQQKSLSLLTTKSAKRTSYEGSKTGTLDTSKARKSSKSNRNSIIQNYTGEELFHLKSGYYNHKR